MREIKIKGNETPMPVMFPRKIVQVKQFVNESQDSINEFLSKIPAEDIVSTHYFVGVDGDSASEFVGVFYKTIDPNAVHPLTESELDKGKILDDIGLRYGIERAPWEDNIDYSNRLLEFLKEK